MTIRTIGIYSGTFDPVHKGHIGFCLEAKRTCGLDEVILLPEACPRGKRFVSDMRHRCALLECAITGLDGLRVLQLASQQCSITATWPELRRHFPTASLTLLIGSDVVNSLNRWQGLETVLPELCFAVGIRGDDTPAMVRTAMYRTAKYYGQPIRYEVIAGAHNALTSSQVRAGQTGGLPNEQVALYVRRHRLYAQ